MDDPTEAGKVAADGSSTGALADAGVPDAKLLASRVLVVDDQAFIRQMIRHCLTTAGFHALEFAADGEEGLAKVESFDPDIVVLDVNMPKRDGIEVVKALRADPRYRRLPVLIQTASSEDEARSVAFAAGATDYVTKPINIVELTTRIRIHLENRLLIAELRSWRDRVDHELDLARDMQMAMLPTAETVAEIAASYPLRLDAHFAPSSELGGDFWGVATLGEGKLGLYSVDFSGHGIGAALNTGRLHTLLAADPPPEEAPDRWLAGLNRKLKAVLPSGQFATMFYGIVDCAAETLTYAAAAAPAPVLGRPGEAPILLAEPSGLPLGVLSADTYEAATVPFPKGAYLFLYSDAVYESPRADGRRMQQADMLAYVEGFALEPAPLAAILAEVEANIVKPVPDDLTALWLARGL